MTDIQNIQPDSRSTTILAAPDREVSVRDLFGIDIDMKVPAFSVADERVPELAGDLFATEDLRGAVRSFLERGPGHASYEGR